MDRVLQVKFDGASNAFPVLLDVVQFLLKPAKTLGNYQFDVSGVLDLLQFEFSTVLVVLSAFPGVLCGPETKFSAALCGLQVDPVGKLVDYELNLTGVLVELVLEVTHALAEWKSHFFTTLFGIYVELGGALVNLVDPSLAERSFNAQEGETYCLEDGDIRVAGQACGYSSDTGSCRK